MVALTVPRALALHLCLAALPYATASAQDTTVASADNPPVWGERVRLIEDLRIGTLDGPEKYLFGRVAAVAARPSDGMIFVLDAQVPIIRQYDADGRFVRNVGREGEGPGEYRRVSGMEILPDGRLAVWDGNEGRITVYDTAGSYDASHRLGGNLIPSESFGIDDDGNFYVAVRDRSRTPGSGFSSPYTFIALSPSGDSIGSIPCPLSERGSAPALIIAASEGLREPFQDERLCALTRSGRVITGHNRSYALDVTTSAGVRRIVRHVEPVELAGDERAQWEAWLDFFRRAMRERGRAGGPFPSLPATKPYYRRLWVDADNRTWVDRYAEATKREVEPREPGDERPPYEWREPPTFDVITSDATFFGTIVMPADVLLLCASGLFVWGRATGEMREHYVVRFRIEPSH